MKKSLVDWLKMKVVAFKMKYATKWIEGYGLSIVRLEHKAGTTYIVNRDGSFHKLIKGKK